MFRLAILLSSAALVACSSNNEQNTENSKYRFEYGNEMVIEKPLVSHVIEFNSGQAELDDTHIDALKPHVDYLVVNPWASVRLQGRSDPSGDIDVNYELALKRAQAIKRHLVDSGVEPTQIQVSSVGEMANNTLAQRSVVLAY